MKRSCGMKTRFVWKKYSMTRMSRVVGALMASKASTHASVIPGCRQLSVTARTRVPGAGRSPSATAGFSSRAPDPGQFGEIDGRQAAKGAAQNGRVPGHDPGWGWGRRGGHGNAFFPPSRGHRPHRRRLTQRRPPGPGGPCGGELEIVAAPPAPSPRWGVCGGGRPPPPRTGEGPGPRWDMRAGEPRGRSTARLGGPARPCSRRSRRKTCSRRRRRRPSRAPRPTSTIRSSDRLIGCP